VESWWIGAGLCTCVLAALWSAAIAGTLRARVEQLELERPKFVLEMEGLVSQCDELLDRAEAKRKRADTQLRAARGNAPADAEPAPPRRLRGTVMERLP
jgi:hypothetical protein